MFLCLRGDISQFNSHILRPWKTSTDHEIPGNVVEFCPDQRGRNLYHVMFQNDADDILLKQPHKIFKYPV